MPRSTAFALLTFDGTLFVDIGIETPLPEKWVAMGLAATWAGKRTYFESPSFLNELAPFLLAL
jgi:hypothetical protein